MEYREMGYGMLELYYGMKFGFFPMGWHISDDIETKKQLLIKALEKNVVLTEIDGINEIMEGVKST